MTEQDINKALSLAKGILEAELETDNGEEIANKIVLLTQILPSLVSCVARSKKLLNLAESKSFAKHQDLQATKLRYAMQGDVTDESALFTYCDNMLAAVRRAITGLQSALGWKKEEMANLRYGGA